MKGLIKAAFLFTALSAFTTQTTGDDFCGMKNKSFQAGETVTMRVFYSTLGMYLSAGEATFTTSLERFNGKTAYHCIGDGKSFPFFDKFFKVRDRYESYIDTATMLPMKFIRNVDEGGYKKYNALLKKSERHGIEKTGEKLRALMPWMPKRNIKGAQAAY